MPFIFLEVTKSVSHMKCGLLNPIGHYIDHLRMNVAPDINNHLRSIDFLDL